MTMPIVKRIVRGLVLGAVMCLAACAASPEPFEYKDTNEVKPGRGVFTGEDGTWTIYRQPMPEETQAAPTEEADAQAEKGGPEEPSPTGEANARA